MNKDDFIDTGSVPVLIPPDEYEAIVKSYKKIHPYNRCIVAAQFEIAAMGKYQGLILEGWFPLRADGTAAPHSKLLRSFLAIDPTIRVKRLRLQILREYLLLVRVRTVEKDSRQQPLPQNLRYSVVDSIVGSVGKIKG